MGIHQLILRAAYLGFLKRVQSLHFVSISMVFHAVMSILTFSDQAKYTKFVSILT